MPLWLDGVGGVEFFLGRGGGVLKKQKNPFRLGIEFEQLKGVVAGFPCIKDGGFVADSGFVEDLKMPKDQSGQMAEVIDNKNSLALGIIVVVDEKTARGLFGAKAKRWEVLFEVDPSVPLDK